MKELRLENTYYLYMCLSAAGFSQEWCDDNYLKEDEKWMGSRFSDDNELNDEWKPVQEVSVENKRSI